MKRLWIIITVSTLLLGCMLLPASAAMKNANDAAEHLYEMGLFKGTGTDKNGNPNFDLSRIPTRAEAITMLVRLLGKEEEALAGTWKTPFLDVADWAKPYVGYAYINGLTSGTSATTFGGDDPVTATQYLTLVLRSLGYSSDTDFAWDRAWEFSDEICLTDGRYSDYNNKFFLRGDVAIVSESSLSVVPKNAVFVDPTGAIPAETGARLLSDERIAAMTNLTVEKASKEITTLADAYAWLKKAGYMTTGMRIGPNIIDNYGWSPTDMSWSEAATTIGLLLEGDYEEVGTLTVIVNVSDPNWWYQYFSAPYVKVGDYYYVTDPTNYLDNTGLPPCRFLTVKTTDLAYIMNYITDKVDTYSGIMTLASYPTTDVPELLHDYTFDAITVHFTNIDHVTYHYPTDAQYEAMVKEKEERNKKELALWQAKSVNLIDKYVFPDSLGQLTLPFEEAVALVGAEPEQIANRVKTVADALQYLIAARFGYNGPDAYTPWYGNWGFDAPGDVQLEQNYGCCCGGYANTASYLLKGDYEKVGELRWVGCNHVINWIYTDGYYYILDFTQLTNCGGYDGYRDSIIKLSRLEDYFDVMPEHLYGDVLDKEQIYIMVAYETEDAGYPSHWEDVPDFKGLTLPSEAEGKVLIIYQKDPDKGVFYKDITAEIPGWTDR